MKASSLAGIEQVIVSIEQIVRLENNEHVGLLLYVIVIGYARDLQLPPQFHLAYDCFALAQKPLVCNKDPDLAQVFIE